MKTFDTSPACGLRWRWWVSRAMGLWGAVLLGGCSSPPAPAARVSGMSAPDPGTPPAASVRPAAPLSAAHTDRVVVEPSPAATNTVTVAEPMQIDSKRAEQAGGPGAKLPRPHQAVTVLGETPPLPEGLPRPESTIPAPRALNLFTVRF